MGEIGVSCRCTKGGTGMKAVQISALTFAIQSFVTLFVIMDPPGATPIFLALVADKRADERRILAIKAAAVSFSVITLFALFGRFILSYLNISMAALQAAGALLLLLISLDLLTGGTGGDKGGKKDSNIALVPLGTPLLAGPGAISPCIGPGDIEHRVVREEQAQSF